MDYMYFMYMYFMFMYIHVHVLHVYVQYMESVNHPSKETSNFHNKNLEKNTGDTTYVHVQYL